MPVSAHTLAAPRPASNGGRLVATDGRPLVLERTTLAAEAHAGLARVVVEQHFTNPYDQPLTVTYTVPLPADGALAGFEFTIGERRVVGTVDRRTAARERFEEAILAGQAAALVEQERTSVFTQEIGNVPPRTSVVARLTVDQPLAWLESGSWEWRFPTVVAPRYLGAEGRVSDAERITVDVSDRQLPPTVAVTLLVRDVLAPNGQVTSPSQEIAVTASAAGLAVGLAAGSVVPDRDVVIRWPVAQAEPGVSVVTARPDPEHAGSGDAYGLVTLVPPEPASAPQPVPRDLIVLLDTSGSMDGPPLAHAIAVASRLVESLTDADTLELIAFGAAPERWRAGAERASARARADALAWLASRRAEGGTEMLEAVTRALAPLRGDGQRQVVLITDGLIGFEDEVVRHIRAHLPDRSRLHTVGVGEATNRSLTAALARVGRGRELVVGLGDDPAGTAAALVAHTRAPLLTDLRLSGSALVANAPERLADVHSGEPLRASVQLRCEGGTLEVTGRYGGSPWSREVEILACAAGTGSAAVWTRFAREYVDDLEALAASGAETDGAIERIGCDFQIATRLTSWVAVSETPSVDPRDPIRRERIPQTLPAGMSAEGLGLRAGALHAIPRGGVQRLGSLVAGGVPLLFEATLRSMKGRMMLSRRVGRVMEPTPSAPPPAVRRRGTARWLPAGTLVIEIAVEDEVLAFPSPHAVTVRFTDGRSRRTLIDIIRTTRAGSYAPGQTVRLVLTVIDPPEDRPAVAEVVVEAHGDVAPLHIDCRP